MTFKHGKFSESVVMRSLEKVAREKGLVKEEDFVKTATVTKRANLNPSSDPLVSLMRLGEGLREAGYEKLAVEIEDKALAFKQAQTLYETSKETGEDLIDFAHPKGSHKLEGVDGTEAVFETILDQHLKSVKMIEKMPTGKLASHKDILGAVKKVLAQDVGAKVPFTPSAMENVFKFTRLLSSLFNYESIQIFRWETDTINAYNRMNSFINRVAASKLISLADIDKIIAMNSDLKTNLSNETFIGIQSTASKDAAVYVNSLQNYLEDSLKEDVKKALATVPKADEGSQKFNEQINSYLSTLRNWSAAVNNDPENSPEDKKQANDWIIARTNELNDLKGKFKPEEAEGFTIALNKSRFVRESGQFKKVWIG